MAITNITLHSGSPLLGSPVYFRLTVVARSGVTFQRAKLKATVKTFLPGDEYYDDEQAFEFSEPITSDGYIYIDVSSALRAMSDAYEYTPHTEAGTQSYPYFLLNASAWDEYMENGVFKTTESSALSPVTPFYFFLGAFTDFERVQSSDARGVTTLTRKPANGEVVPADAPLYIYPLSFTYTADDWFSGTSHAAPTTTAVVVPGLLNNIPGRTVWQANIPDEYVAFQFVNGYGVIESAYAFTLPDESVTKTVKEYTISTPMRFNKINRNIVRKSGSRHVFKMSSGPVTEEWQQWWLEEFLNTEQCWMYHKGSWLPVSIVPDEETSAISRSKEDLPEVQFTVKLNIEGHK
jgi:hypothetical protein